MKAKSVFIAIIFLLVATVLANAETPNLTPKQSLHGEYTYILIDPTNIVQGWELVNTNDEYFPFYEYYYVNTQDFSANKIEYACIVYHAVNGFIAYAVFRDGVTYVMIRSGNGFVFNEESQQKEPQDNWNKDWARFCMKGMNISCPVEKNIEPRPDITIRGYACNWTEKELDVVIMPNPEYEWKHDPTGHVFTLLPQATIGNPELYRGTLVPNCYELRLVPGLYDIKYRYTDGEWKADQVKICCKMKQPFTLDFEE